MRHFQWSDNSWEQRAFPGKELCFEEDIPGGVRCTCGFCGESICIYDNTNSCPRCDSPLVFPRADW